MASPATSKKGGMCIENKTNKKINSPKISRLVNMVGVRVQGRTGLSARSRLLEYMVIHEKKSFQISYADSWFGSLANQSKYINAAVKNYISLSKFF